MKSVVEKGFILKVYQYSEADLIVHALNPYGEKLHLLARGARKSRKRFGGGILEPTHYVELHFDRSLSAERMHVLKEARLVEAFSKLRTDYQKLELAFYFLTRISQFSQEGDGHSPELFDLLGNALQAIQTSKQLQILRLQFDMKLLHSQGILPPDTMLCREFLSVKICDHEQIPIAGESLQQLSQKLEYLLQQA